MHTTNKYTIPLLEEGRYRDYEFILEDYELAFHKKQLKQIGDDWNSGMELEEISQQHKRHIHEVLLALIHLGIKNRIKRPFAMRM